MLVTRIFCFSHNVFYPFKGRNDNMINIYLIICTCFEPNPIAQSVAYRTSGQGVASSIPGIGKYSFRGLMSLCDRIHSSLTPVRCFDNRYDRRVLSQIRLSAHCLHIQTGRYSGNRVDRNLRLCNICQNGDIEDEFHFIFICCKYEFIRKRYIDTFYRIRPNMRKLCQLLSSNNKRTLQNLIYYLKCAFTIRKNELFG